MFKEGTLPFMKRGSNKTMGLSLESSLNLAHSYYEFTVILSRAKPISTASINKIKTT